MLGGITARKHGRYSDDDDYDDDDNDEDGEDDIL